ncbi:M15 family metallopeptidase [Sinomonas sp. B1-1]|uniref:M15 family metallopeptidase n=1 Tax=Sinomonas sp. B1-1 TaxID=3141454 RepID=UPI003D26762B
MAAPSRSGSRARRRRGASAALAALAALALSLSACSPTTVVERSEAESTTVVERSEAESTTAVERSEAESTTAVERSEAESKPPNAAPSPSPSDTPTYPSPTAAAAPAPSSAPTVSTDPANPLVVVNKRRPLAPIDFAPQLVAPNVVTASGQQELLNPVTAHAAEQMFAAATADGAPMTLLSGYRSYATQVATYNGWVARQGQEAADVASARPGYSEHQTGFAFDIGDPSGACSLQPCFKDTKAALWVAAHAHEYGFIVRYPWWYHETTGYYYEPWHLRYIGVEAATDMHRRGVATLEEYLGLPAAPAYGG